MLRAVVTALLITLGPGPAFAQSVTGHTLPDTSSAATSRAVATTPPAQTIPSVRSLFTDLGQDFRQLPSRESAVILGLAAGLAAGVHHSDTRLTTRAVGSGALDSVFEVGAVGGGGWVQLGGAVGTYALGRATRSPRAATVGADLIRAQMMTALFTQGLKLSVGRRRPDGSSFSFPSGHTSSTFATATVVQRHFGWKAGIPAYAFATYVAGSRLQENKHFASDVIVGAALGIVSGRAVTVGRGRATFALTPFGAPGGAGVGLTLVGRE